MSLDDHEDRLSECNLSEDLVEKLLEFEYEPPTPDVASSRESNITDDSSTCAEGPHADDVWESGFADLSAVSSYVHDGEVIEIAKKLPPSVAYLCGWEAIVDTRWCRPVVYFNVFLRRAQWDLPFEMGAWHQVHRRTGVTFQHTHTGQLSTVPPEWVAELDGSLKAVVFRNQATGETSHSVPEGFVPLIKMHEGGSLLLQPGKSRVAVDFPRCTTRSTRPTKRKRQSY